MKNKELTIFTLSLLISLSGFATNDLKGTFARKLDSLAQLGRGEEIGLLKYSDVTVIVEPGPYGYSFVYVRDAKSISTLKTNFEKHGFPIQEFRESMDEDSVTGLKCPSIIRAKNVRESDSPGPLVICKNTDKAQRHFQLLIEQRKAKKGKPNSPPATI